MTLLRNNLTLSPDNIPLFANKGRVFVRKINSFADSSSLHLHPPGMRTCRLPGPL